jgi:hypothetical protein
MGRLAVRNVCRAIPTYMGRFSSSATGSTGLSSDPAYVGRLLDTLLVPRPLSSNPQVCGEVNTGIPESTWRYEQSPRAWGMVRRSVPVQVDCEQSPHP